MRIALVSTSLNPDSKGFQLCKVVEAHMQTLQDDTWSVELIDLRNYPMEHIMKPFTPEAEVLKVKMEGFDAFILGMAVYNYNVNDAFATFVGKILPKKEHALYGLIVAAGGDLSYLASTSAHQMLMTHNRMIPLPRILYGGRSWDGVHISEDLQQRIDQFCHDFLSVGAKLSDTEVDNKESL